MGKKNKVGGFFKCVIKNNEETRIPYPWISGELDDYIKVCESVRVWGGIPLDVDWARGTNSYKEVLQEYKLKGEVIAIKQ